MRNFMMVGIAVVAIGCGSSKPKVGGVQTVILPARPASCELELVTITAQDMAPGARFGGELQMIGSVSLAAEKGTDVMSPEIKQLIRARACGYGGTVVSLLATFDSEHRNKGSWRVTEQTNVVFTVWAPREAPAAAAQRF